MRAHRFIALLTSLLVLGAVRAAVAETTLVVVQRADRRLVTHWLESDGNAHEIKAVLPLPLFAVGETLHAWRTTTPELALCDCAALDGWQGAGICPSAGQTGRGAALGLISLDDGRLSQPIPPRVLQPGEVISRYRGRVRLLGSVGPYVFVQLEQWLGSCLSETDIQESQFVVWDLVSGRAAVLYDRKEIASLRTSEQVEAFEHLRDVTTADSFKELEFTAIHPGWTAQDLALAYQFTAPVCTTCGDDTWASGLRSAMVPAESTPRRLESWERAPRSLDTFRMAHPDAVVLGWTQLDGEQAARDAQLVRLQGLVR